MEVDSLKTMLNVNSGANAYSRASNTTPAEKINLVLSEPAANKNAQVGGQSSVSANTEKNQNGQQESAQGKKPGVEEDVSNEFFDKFIEEANSKIFMTNREFSYSFHEATNRVVVKVLDKKTKEVIREIPPEKNLDAVAKMMELVGIIIDEKI